MRIDTDYTDVNWNAICVGDILRVDVELNKEQFGDYIYCLVKEDKKEEYFSWFYVDKQFATCDLENCKNPLVVSNLEAHPNFTRTYTI